MQNKELLREKKMKLVEEKMSEAVDEARLLGITLPELREMLTLLFKERV
jgi:GntR family transcriptional regulator